jgi:hypothetical protein
MELLRGRGRSRSRTELLVQPMSELVVDTERLGTISAPFERAHAHPELVGKNTREDLLAMSETA